MNNDVIIKEMGCLFADFGINPILGEIFGILLCSEKPVSLIDIAQTLSLSKAAVSIQIRVLENLGYCRRVPKTSDRQHRYQLRENYLENVYSKRIDREKAYLQAVAELPVTKTDPVVSSRLEGFITFSSRMINAQEVALAVWHKEKQHENTDTKG